MDREIPKEVRNKERNKKIIRYGGMGAAGIVVISVLISLMRTGGEGEGHRILPGKYRHD